MMTNDLFKYFIQEKDIILTDSKNEIPRIEKKKESEEDDLY